MRILLVEDDEVLAASLEKILNEQHYVIDVAYDGQTGWELFEAFTYDLILLDVILPRLDGIKFCQQLRAKDSQIPVLMLTAQNASKDKVIGLDAGADDYLVKPFELSELLARVRALLRRKSSPEKTILEWLNLRLDPDICKVTYRSHVLHLTPKEYRLLELFLRNHHRVFSRSAILDHLWSCEESPREDTVTAHIKALRQKLKEVGAPADLIETVYGQGYCLKQPQSSSAEASSLASEAQTQVLYQQTKLRLALVWKKYQGLSRDRLSVLEQATTEWLEKRLGEEQRQRAQQAAHKLAGSLGIFGFADGSNLAKRVEKTLQSDGILSQGKARYLFSILSTLRKIVEQPVAEEPTPLTNTELNAIKENTPEDSSEQPADKPRRSDPDGSRAPLAKLGLHPSLLLMIDDDPVFAQRIRDLAEEYKLSIKFVSSLSALKYVINAPMHFSKIADLESVLQSHVKSHHKADYATPDIVLLNVSFENVIGDNLALLTELVNQTPPLPVLLLTAQDNLNNRVKLAHLPAHVFLQKSLLPEQLLEIIARVRSHSQATAAKVMVVDDDPELLEVMQTLLEPLGLNLTTLDQPLQFWHTFQEFCPDLLVLDVKMPHFSGIELCQVLRNTPKWGNLPILFLTGHTDSQTVNQVFAAGANDCISKAIGKSELLTRLLKHLEHIRLFQGLEPVGS